MFLDRTSAIVHTRPRTSTGLNWTFCDGTPGQRRWIGDALITTEAPGYDEAGLREDWSRDWSGLSPECDSRKLGSATCRWQRRIPDRHHRDGRRFRRGRREGDPHLLASAGS